MQYTEKQNLSNGSQSYDVGKNNILLEDEIESGCDQGLDIKHAIKRFVMSSLLHFYRKTYYFH